MECPASPRRTRRATQPWRARCSSMSAAADGRAGRHGARARWASGCSASTTWPCPGRPGACRSSSPNIARFEREWELPRMEFRAWVALHEVTHRFEFAGPWARDHFLGLVRDLVEHAEIDLSSLQQRLEAMDLSDPEAMSQGMEGVGNLFGEATSTSSACASPACRRSSGGGGLRRPRHRGGRAHDALVVRQDRRGGPPLPRGPPRRPGAGAAAGPADDRRAAPPGPGVLRHGGRADRRGHAGPDVGLGRLAARRCPSWRNRRSGWREWPDRPRFPLSCRPCRSGTWSSPTSSTPSQRAAQGDMGQSVVYVARRSPGGRFPSTSSAPGRRRPATSPRRSS